MKSLEVEEIGTGGDRWLIFKYVNNMILLYIITFKTFFRLTGSLYFTASEDQSQCEYSRILKNGGMKEVKTEDELI